MASVSSSFKSLCTPAMIYLVIGVISLLFMIGQVSIMALVVKVIFLLLWTWFLNFLCSKGYTGISWFLVVIPYVFLVLILIFAVDVLGGIAKQDAQQQQQQQTQQVAPSQHH